MPEPPVAPQVGQRKVSLMSDAPHTSFDKSNVRCESALAPPVPSLRTKQTMVFRYPHPAIRSRQVGWAKDLSLGQCWRPSVFGAAGHPTGDLSRLLPLVAHGGDGRRALSGGKVRDALPTTQVLSQNRRRQLAIGRDCLLPIVDVELR